MSTVLPEAGRKYKTLASNTALISLGTVGSKLMMFFMVRFYTGYMSPADYGTADIITQTANLLIPLVSLGMAEGVFRFAAMVPDKCREAFTVGIVCTIAGTAVLAAVLPRIPGAAGYGTLLTVYVACSCVHSICAQYVRALSDMAVYAVQGLINTALVIGFNIMLLAVFRLGVTGYVLSVAAADAGCTVWLTAKKRLWSALTRHISRPLFRRLVAYSVPLIPTSIFWWITGVSDRYMISGFLSSAANGIYSVAGKIPTMLTVLATVFMDAWQLSAVTEAHGDRAEHRKFYSRIWALFQGGVIICSAVMIALSRVGVMLLADEEYFSAWRYIPALTLAMVCSAFSSFLGSVYVVTGESRRAFRTAMAGAALNIVLNLALIPSPLGVQGAAIATFISCLAVFLIRAASVKRLIAFDLRPLRCAVNLIILSVQAAVMVLEPPMYPLLQLLAAAALCAVNRAPLIQCARTLTGYLRPVGKHLTSNRR